MKTATRLLLISFLSASPFAMAASDNMQGMDMRGTAPAASALHQASGVVKAVDRSSGKVTLQHGPIPTLKWPAMTMTFSVRDKALLDKLKVGEKVDVGIAQHGNDYVIEHVD